MMKTSQEFTKKVLKDNSKASLCSIKEASIINLTGLTPIKATPYCKKMNSDDNTKSPGVWLSPKDIQNLSEYKYFFRQKK